MFGGLNSSDYVRYVQDLYHSTVTVNSSNFPRHQQFYYDYYYSQSRQQRNIPPSIGQYHHQELTNRIETLDLAHVMSVDGEELINLAKNSNSSKQIYHLLLKSNELRNKFYAILIDPRTGGGALNRLSTDSNANFIVQLCLGKLIANEADTGSASVPLIQAIERIAPKLALNRYGCRVVQKCVQVESVEGAHKLLACRFKGAEYQLITDQNANHIIQFVINKFNPEVYAKFLESLIASVGLKKVIEDKYGCRVLQCALERTIEQCKLHQHQQFTHPARKAAYDLLHLLLMPILDDAGNFSKNEFANYIIQVVMKEEFLAQQRKYIIKEHLMHNIIVLAQGKFSSHVVEVAISHADDECLEAMFLEVFEGYNPDEQGRNALHFMLFNQFGNYVVQKMLEIATQVRLGKRKGDPTWFDKIVNYALGVKQHLQRYSSGKKILDMIQLAISTLYNNSAASKTCQTAYQPCFSIPSNAAAMSYNNNSSFSSSANSTAAINFNVLNNLVVQMNQLS